MLLLLLSLRPLLYDIIILDIYSKTFAVYWKTWLPVNGIHLCVLSKFAVDVYCVCVTMRAVIDLHQCKTFIHFNGIMQPFNITCGLRAS